MFCLRRRCACVAVVLLTSAHLLGCGDDDPSGEPDSAADAGDARDILAECAALECDPFPITGYPSLMYYIPGTHQITWIADGVENVCTAVVTAAAEAAYEAGGGAHYVPPQDNLEAGTLYCPAGNVDGGTFDVPIHTYRLGGAPAVLDFTHTRDGEYRNGHLYDQLGTAYEWEQVGPPECNFHCQSVTLGFRDW